MSKYKQTDIVTVSNPRGGKRENSGRKLKYSEPTATIRLPVSMIERIKQGFDNVVYSNQNEFEILKEKLEQSTHESLVIADKLASAENELAEQGKLIMKLIKEKKNLEINLGLKKPEIAKPKAIEAMPPAKVEKVNLQGIAGTTAKTAKVTLVIDPATIPRIDSTGKKQTSLKIAVENMTFQADLNSKSYRKAIAAIDELGAEHCMAILQGSMKMQGKLEGVGLVIQAKKAKEESSETHTE